MTDFFNPTVKAPQLENIPQPGMQSRPQQKVYGSNISKSELLPLFAEAAQRHNVPLSLLTAIAQQESNFNASAIGQPTQYGRAMGIMQYIPDTARALQINPFDPAQAINAAAMQMRQRMDGGYSDIEAVAAHFAGDDRKQWGPKTKAYTQDVLAKAGNLDQELQSYYTQASQQQETQTELTEQEQLNQAEEEKGFFSRAWGAAGHGIDNVKNSLAVSKATLSGDPEALADLLMENIQAEQQRGKTRGQQETSEAIGDVGRARGLWQTTDAAWEAAKTAFSNPKDLAVDIVEQGVNMLAPLVGGVGGAATGALAGSVIPGAGSAAGAVIGGYLGSAAGTASLEFGNEVKEAVIKELTDKNIPVTAENVYALVSDQGFMEGAKKQAAIKGVTLAAVDTIMMKTAGSIARAPAQGAKKKALAELAKEGKYVEAGQGLKQFDHRLQQFALSSERGKELMKDFAPTKGQSARAYGGAFGVELAGEPAGELVSQLAARGEVDKGDVFAEALYGGGMAVGGTAMGSSLSRINAARKGIKGIDHPDASEAGGSSPQPDSPNSPDPSLSPDMLEQTEEAYAPQTPPDQPLTAALNAAQIEEAWLGEVGTAVNQPLSEDFTITGTITNYQDGMAVVRAEDGREYYLPKDKVEEALNARAQAMAAMTSQETVAPQEIFEQQYNQATQYQEAAEPDFADYDAYSRMMAETENRPSTAQANEEPISKTAAPAIEETVTEAAPVSSRRIVTSKGEVNATFPDDAHKKLYQYGAARNSHRNSGSTLSAERAEKAFSEQKTAVTKATSIPASQVNQAAQEYYHTVFAEAQSAINQGESELIATPYQAAKPGQAKEQRPAADNLIVKSDGKPFANQAQALRSIKHKGVKGHEPVQVEGGWALQPVKQEKAVEPKKTAKPAQAKPAMEQKVAPAVDGKADSVVEQIKKAKLASYTTNKGKEKPGYYLQNVTVEQAKQHDPGAFKTKQGIFVNEKRVEHLRSASKQSPASNATYGSNNKLVTTDRAAELRKRLKAKLHGQLNVGIDPEVLAIGVELAAFHIEAGARKFADFVAAIAKDLDTTPDKIRKYLRAWYNGARDLLEDSGMDVSGMESAEQVRAELQKLSQQEKRDLPFDPRPATGLDAMVAELDREVSQNLQESQDVPTTRVRLEQDSSKSETENSRIQQTVQSGSREPGQSTGSASQPMGESRGTRGDNHSIAKAGPTDSGKRSDQQVHSAKQPARAKSSTTRDPVSARSSEDSATGQQTNGRGERSSGKPAQTVRTVTLADSKNITDTLPQLYPEQHGDVQKIEARFKVGNGMLLTNGTGTGKTYSGLGVVARFAMEGKDNTIIVVPNDKIASDWMKAAKESFDLDVHQLESTQENGDKGIVVTTYANFGVNNSLVNRDWDLVVADESHYLMSNAQSNRTNALETLRAITGHHAGLNHYLNRRYPDVYAALDTAKAEDNEKAKNAAYSELKKIRAKHKDPWSARWTEQKGLPKTLMLSATPFAYTGNLDYAEGYLFHFVPPGEVEERAYSYNEGDTREKFYMNNFGYRMRYNRLTKPDADVNTDLMEQNFNERMKKEGAIAGRLLETSFDYDRKFVMVDDAIGTKLDEGLQWLADAADGKYRPVLDAVMAKFEYHNRMFLLESLKAKHAVDMARQYLKEGRKVVIFHDFNKGGGFHPFKDALSGADSDVIVLAREAYATRPDLLRMDFKNLQSPIETFTQAFGDKALLFNGTISKRQRRKNAELFNDDNSEHNLILLQSDAGREGISLHDTTGKHQRVLINLGMPSKPVAAMQIEGRIYRTGQQSNALFRYLTTGSGWESSTFAHKIAERSSTAENLALGSDARGLRHSFIDAYQNADLFSTGEEDGTGGKAYDRSLSAASTISDFDRAKTYYYAQQKNNKRRGQREGEDYYATPEPVGFKMVEFADIQPGDSVLEPSAGHGAIARFIPGQTDVTLIEPSYDLSSRAALARGDADIINDRFESHHIINKYNAIVMNPPYGTGGKTAIEHLAKAAQHLREGGRIVALLPKGGLATRRLDAFIAKEAKNLHLAARIEMPRSTFERAGTSVATEIVVFDKHTALDGYIKTAYQNLSGAESVNELFDRIENITIPARGKNISTDGKPVYRKDKKGNSQGEPLTVMGAERVVKAYITDELKNNVDLEVRVRKSTPKERSSGERIFGYINGNTLTVVSDAHITEADLRTTLRHEILGHYGLDALGKERKAQILTAVAKTQDSAAMEKIWNKVNHDYQGASLLERAEEVFATVAQTERGMVGKLWDEVRTLLVKALRAIGLIKADLFPVEFRNLSRHIARGIRAGKLRAEEITGRKESKASVEDVFKPDAREAEKYRDDLKKVMNSLRSKPLPVNIGKTSDVLKAVGVPDLDMMIFRDVVRKATNRVKHHVPMQVIEQLPELLHDPVAVFESRTEKDSVVVLLEAVDFNQDPVIAAIHFSKRVGRLAINNIASVYGKENSDRFIAGLVEENRMLYSREKKSLDPVRLMGLQLPGSGSPKQGSTKTILTADDLVNQQRKETLADESVITANDIIKNTRYRKEKGKYEVDLDAVESSRILGWIKSRLDVGGKWMAMVPLNYFEELAPKSVTAIKQYLRAKQDMDAYRGNAHAVYDTIAKRWQKFASRNMEAGKNLADVMHDSTIAQIDPSQPLPAKANRATEATWKKLKAQFNALPKEAQALYGVVRDAYQSQTKDLDKILSDNVAHALELALGGIDLKYQAELKRIKSEGLTGEAKARATSKAKANQKAEKLMTSANNTARMIRLRQFFESNRLTPYFPLARFGEYMVTVRDKEDNVVSFSKFEKELAAKEFANKMKKEGYQSKVEFKGTSFDQKDADPRFVAAVQDILGRAEVSDEIREQIWQRYLETMPDMSLRKGFIRRKGRAGYSGDALRVFGYKMFHGSHQLARLKYGQKMQSLLDEMGKQAAEVEKTNERLKAQKIHTEIQKRHAFIMQPTGSKAAQTVTSLAFTYYLGMTPAAAVVNLSQTAILGVPILGARYGMSNSTKALLKASKDFAVGKGKIADGNLTADEREAVATAYDMGAIDRTQSHDLAGVGETGVEYNVTRARVMESISFMFHHSERFNREITFLAAYRLALKNKESHAKAIETAAALTKKIHFDYSNTNRARILQSDAAKVMLVFRNYNINMLFRLFRDIHQVFKGDTPQARKEAAYQLGGIISMMTLNAGLRGVPFYGIAMLLGQLFFGDDDDGFDFETQFRNGVLETVGPTAGGLLLNGVPGTVLGIDLSSRIGLPDLWFRSPDRQLEGKEEYLYWLEQIAGAAPSMVANAFRGIELMNKGHAYRGLETVAPKAVRDWMRGYRYMEEGVTNIRGVSLVDDPSWVSSFRQVVGFTPSEISEAYKRNSAIKNAEQSILGKRTKLLDQYNRAVLQRDAAKQKVLLGDIMAYNKMYPEKRISGRTLRQSFKARERGKVNQLGGVYIDPALAPRLRAGYQQGGRVQ